jgi:hypothetical protein
MTWETWPSPDLDGIAPGSSPGEYEARKSVNEEVCRPRKPDGEPPAAPGLQPDTVGFPANGPDWLPSKYESNADLLP